MRALLILSLLTAHVKAAATTVLVQGPEAQILDYRATLKAHADSVSPTQDYLNAHPLVRERENLLVVFSEAQKSFLEKSNEEARKKFIEVLALLTNDDWAKGDREIFLHAYLRLAQLESDSAQRDHWLSLSLLLGEALNYDNMLFPPPLLVRRKQLSQDLPRQLISRKNWAPEWTQVLINGQPCGHQDCGQWLRLAGRVRVTFLSDKWMPQSLIVNSSDLLRLHPREIVWAEGGCGQVRWHDGTPHNRKIFWNLECDKTTLPITLNIMPATGAEAEAVPTLALQPERKAFYKSPWFWAGVGTAVVVAVVIASSKSKEKREPTTSYGY